MSKEVEIVKREGIVTLSESNYHADTVADVPSLSSSIAKILCAESPLHAWTAHPRLNPNFVREEKEIFDLGGVAHALMLEGEDHACVLDYADWRSKDARQARDDARAMGRTPILTKHWNRVQAMIKAGKDQIAAHREAKDAFLEGNGLPEETLVWTDDHGVVCRARPDWIKNGKKRIFDYKGTGTSVNPESLGRFAVSQGWDIQSAFYLRGIQKLFGIDAEFFFVAQEDYPPYALTVAGMPPPFRWIGDKKVQMAIDLWAQCLESGKWPAYSDRIIYPDLPAFVEAAFLEKELKQQ